MNFKKFFAKKLKKHFVPWFVTHFVPWFVPLKNKKNHLVKVFCIKVTEKVAEQIHTCVRVRVGGRVCVRAGACV